MSRQLGHLDLVLCEELHRELPPALLLVRQLAALHPGRDGGRELRAEVLEGEEGFRRDKELELAVQLEGRGRELDEGGSGPGEIERGGEDGEAGETRSKGSAP